MKKFISICDIIMAFSFYALIYFLPISIALTETFSSIALFFFFLKRGTTFFYKIKEKTIDITSLNIFGKLILFVKEFKPIDSLLTIPIGIFLFFNLISVITSQMHQLSIIAFFGKVLQSAFVYFTFIECINSKKRLKIFLIIYLISYTLISVDGLFQYFFHTDFIRGQLSYDNRISSCLRTHNDFAAYLLFIIPVSLFLLLYKLGFKLTPKGNSSDASLNKYCKNGKYFFAFLSTLSIYCLGLTFSRGAWIGMILSFIFFSFFKFNKRILTVIIIISILFLIIFIPIIFQSRFETNSFHNLLDHDGGRRSYWKEAINIIKDYPLFGVGLNCYSRIGGQYKINWGGYPHNCYLQITAETGIFGILSFLLIIFSLFKESIAFIYRNKNEYTNFLVSGFLLGLFAFLLHSFFDTIFYSVQLSHLTWIIFGIITNLIILSKSTNESAIKDSFV